jgi:hypothetical protein
MKETTLAKILAVACGLGLATALAQTSTTVTTTKDAATGTAVTETTTTTNTSGTITEYTPGSDYFMLRAGTTGAPARFYYTNEAPHVFDPEGHPLSWSVLRPDIPATVYYVREGDRMIVRKVVLNKPVTTTTVTREVTTTGPAVATEPVATNVYVAQTPPAVRVEGQTVAPGPGYIWTPGYWRWSGTNYVWVSGSWVRPPRTTAVWVAGHWVHQDRGWVWVPGQWR